ncbi:MAG TPA: TIGR03663 family protein [bacterium]|nr:TIGR03663 family protein [bacterium]HQG46952.1 TIGR03663 family protein [bacterium]HQJ65591.1 TIGR03663 family protein [bacterium]
MRKNSTFIASWCFILLLAAVLRLPRLQHRPMHTDEAVHAVKFAVLLQEGSYTYDAQEYHGPTLYYFTLIPAWLRGQSSLEELDEATLRLVAVSFGLSLVLLPLLLAPLISRPAALAAGFWIALSPMQVFYSRYYIQEVLFVFFGMLALICAGRYLQQRHWAWALGAGGALGLLHATKETDIVLIVAAASAAMVVWLRERPHVSLHGRDLLLALAAALLVSALFFTAGFTHPQGLLDSFRAYNGYLHRGAGQTLHTQPWYYYFNLLFWHHEPGHPWWSEIWIAPFLAAGLWSARDSRGQNSARSITTRFICSFTLILCILYSLLPYKTPWNALAFYYCFLIIAGLGWRQWLEQTKKWQVALYLSVIICSLLISRQAVLLNQRQDSDPGNPWVYAHPGPDLARITSAVKTAAAAAPEGLRTPVQVAVTGDEYWPLPWTLRRMPNIGWYDRLDESLSPAPLILISPEQEPLLQHLLYEIPPPGQRNLYLPLWRGYAELRPGQELHGYIRKDLHDLLDPSAGTQPLTEGIEAK